MARNWDMAASGGLGSLIDAYYGGRDRANALEDRDRNWGIKNLELDRTQNREDPYNIIVRDKRGIPTGFAENEELKRRDEAPSAARAPEFFGKSARPGAEIRYQDTADDDLEKKYGELQETINKQQDQLRNQDAGGRSPHSAIEPDHAIGYREYPPRGDIPATGVADTTPGDPKPLLKDHKLAAQSAQSAQKASQLPKKALSADEIVADIESDNTPLPKSGGPISARTKTGENPKFDLDGYKRAEFEAKDGVPTRLKKSAVEFPEQTITAGEDYMPAEDTQMRVPPKMGAKPTIVQEEGDDAERYNPSPYMRKRITDMVTSAPRMQQKQSVALASLHPQLLKRLGITDPDDPSLRLSIPEDVLQTWLRISGGSDTRSIDPAAFSFARQIQAKTTDLGSALEDFSTIVGRNPTPAEVNFIAGVDKQRGINDRADENRGHQDKMAFSRAAGQAASKFSKEYKSVFDKIGGIASARKLIATGDASVLGIAGRLLLKGVGEHAITDRDINAAAGDANFIEMARQQYNKMLADVKLDPENAGMITKANRAFFERVADVLSKAALKKFEEAAQLPIKELRLMAKTTGSMTPDQAEKLFREEFDIGAIRGGMEKTLNDTQDVPKKENVNPRLQQLEEKYKKTVERISTSKLSAAEKKEALSEAEMMINSARRNLGGKK